MRNIILSIGIIVIGSLSLPVFSAETIPAKDARIVEVTVYQDRAEVVKEVRLQVPGGASTIEFQAVPIDVEVDTLRISAEGVPVTLGAMEILDRADEPIETEEWKAARDEVRSLEREIATLDEAGVVDEELRSFLRSLAAATSTTESREIGEGRGDPEAIRDIYKLMQGKFNLLAESKIDRRENRRELGEQLKLARAKLATLRPASRIRSRVVEVQVEADRAGSLTLRLAYLAPGASWRPSYRATLNADTEEVEMVAEGVVRQNTGEDWSSVDLKLSTAAPARGVEPPMLMPWVIEPVIVTASAYESYSDSEGAELKESARMYQNVLQMAPEAASVVAGETRAELVRSAYNVSFRVPGGSDVPSDGRDHRVVLRRENFKVNLVHRTVPGLAPRAYLTAVTTSPEDYPLLAGHVRVFAEGAYLGRFPLLETGPGKELTLPFGVDNRIEVIRVPQPEVESREGFTGKQRQIRKIEKTLLHNLMDRKVTLVLEDRLPVSKNEQIVVQIGKDTTPGYKDSERRPGVKLWTLELGPGEKREIVLDYTVRYPRGMLIDGLD